MSDLLEQPAVPTVASYWPGTTSERDSPYKRSGKSKKDLLKCYKQRTSMSRKWRKDSYDKVWTRLIDLYKGKHFNAESRDDRIAINISFSTVNVIVPSVAVNDPFITVNPRSADMVDGAAKIEAGINYWWRRYHWKNEVKRAVKDSIVVGHGWVKLGWKYSETKRPLSDAERQTHYQGAMEEATAAAVANPAIAADLPSNADIYDALPTHTDEAAIDHPFVERCSPFDIFVDPEATADTDLKWIAQKVVVPLERVKADSRYSQAARNELKADMSTNPRWRDGERANSSDKDGDDDIQRVTLWEYWDVEHEFYCVFADASDKFLVDPTDFPYPFGIPFIYLPNYEVVDQFYSVGDLEMIEPIQHELNGVRSDMMNHRKRWQRAYLAKRDKLDTAAMAQLGSDEDGRVIFIDGDEDLDGIVKPLQQTPLDPQMYNYSQQVESDLELVSGITEYQRGAAPEVRRTATEANLIQSATNARVSDKLAQVEAFMASIAERVVQLAQMYLTGEEVARIVGSPKQGEQPWVTFTREQIEGEYDFTVEAGSTQPRDDNYRRDQALQLLQTVGPYVGQVLDAKAVLTHVLRDGFGIKDVDSLFSQAPPQQSQSQKLIETLSYKDAPPDIQRQMEAEAGFKPSQVGGSAPVEQADNQLPAAMPDGQAPPPGDQQMLAAAMAAQPPSTAVPGAA